MSPLELALVLLLLNSRTAWIGERFRNRPLTAVFLVLILLFFVGAGYLAIT